MKHFIIIIKILLITSFIFAQYKIPQSVIGNGGAITVNSSHRINGTIGQNIIGSAVGGPFSSSAGFWYIPGRIITDVGQLTSTLPIEYCLYQNYPNPFNPSTTIIFDIPKKSFVTLRIYNLLGQEVAELLNEEKQPGTYSVNWDASGFASGVYFYSIQAKDYVETKKLILIR